MTKPNDHEPWCMEAATGECVCDFDERCARWERENRDPHAAELPRAVARYKESHRGT